MQTSTFRTALGAAALAGALALSSCASDTGAAPDSTPVPTSSQNESQDPQLLQLNGELKETLGQKYSEGWIADNKLHVAVTDQAAADTVSAAGAVSHLAKYSATELEAAISKVMKWQQAKGGAIATAIHRYVPSGRDGTITLAVDPDELKTIKEGLAADDVTGGISLVFTKSAGPASPAASE